jgi:uncharacterized surface protein with fasciclin (FAS1) repeats
VSFSSPVTGDWGAPQPAVYRVPDTTLGRLPLGPERLLAQQRSMTTPAAPLANTLDTAAANGNLTKTLVAAHLAGLASLLASDAPFTLLAPTDAAFANLPTTTLRALLEDPAALAELLRFHLIPGSLDSAQLRTVDLLWTASGQTLRADRIQPVCADITTSNGMIHVIDKVLLPASGGMPPESRNSLPTGEVHELVPETPWPSA